MLDFLNHNFAKRIQVKKRKQLKTFNYENKGQNNSHPTLYYFQFQQRRWKLTLLRDLEKLLRCPSHSTGSFILMQNIGKKIFFKGYGSSPKLQLFKYTFIINWFFVYISPFWIMFISSLQNIPYKKKRRQCQQNIVDELPRIR